MKITNEIIEQIANLSCLEVSEDEKEMLVQQIESIISYIEKLNELDTNGIAPMGHIIAASNELREDAVTDSLERNQIADIAPVFKNGCYIAPKILDYT